MKINSVSPRTVRSLGKRLAHAVKVTKANKGVSSSQKSKPIVKKAHKASKTSEQKPKIKKDEPVEEEQ